jgi:hypothetical protein
VDREAQDRDNRRLTRNLKTAHLRPRPVSRTSTSAAQAGDLLEVIDDRHQRRSTILTSQLPINTWHDNLGDPTLADAICDRILHTAHRIELRGESLRKPHHPTPPPRRPTPKTDNR